MRRPVAAFLKAIGELSVNGLELVSVEVTPQAFEVLLQDPDVVFGREGTSYTAVVDPVTITSLTLWGIVVTKAGS